jgi:2-polyprenyl-3-methyl-5-hydroxy-6-metoxy-1,4-benzoquinol methylase
MQQLQLPEQTRRGLEIGCGDGWWLETCKRNNVACYGIEPEESFKDYHKERGLDVTYGFYPDVNGGGKEAFDFIIFNDVFEHIPDINTLMNSLKADLNENGLLIINLPMSNGFFYRVAKFMCVAGFTSYLERMWQFYFHSPHINYFNEENLKAFMLRHRLQCIKELRLDTINFKYLKQRIRTDRQMNTVKATLLTKVLMLLKPVVSFSKPDIKAYFFKRVRHDC